MRKHRLGMGVERRPTGGGRRREPEAIGRTIWVVDLFFNMLTRRGGGGVDWC